MHLHSSVQEEQKRVLGRVAHLWHGPWLRWAGSAAERGLQTWPHSPSAWRTGAPDRQRGPTATACPAPWLFLAVHECRGRAGARVEVSLCFGFFLPPRESAVNLVRSGSYTRQRRDEAKGSETPQTVVPPTYVSTYLKRYQAQWAGGSGPTLATGVQAVTAQLQPTSTTR